MYARLLHLPLVLAAAAAASSGCGSGGPMDRRDADLADAPSTDASISNDAARDAMLPPVTTCPDQPGPALLIEGEVEGRTFQQVRATRMGDQIILVWVERHDDASGGIVRVMAKRVGADSTRDVWESDPNQRINTIRMGTTGERAFLLFDVWPRDSDVTVPGFTVRTEVFALGVDTHEHVDTLNDRLSPFVSSRNDRVDVLVANASDAEHPGLELWAIREAALEMERIVLDDLFEPPGYGWYALWQSPDGLVGGVRNEENGVIAAGPIEEPVTTWMPLAMGQSVHFYHIAGTEHHLAFGESPGDRVTAHRFHWDGSGHVETPVSDLGSTYDHIVSWGGHLAAVHTRLSPEHDDDVDVLFRWLEAEEPTTLGRQRVYQRGAATSGYSDGPAVVNDEELHLFIPTHIDADANGSHDQFEVGHLTACFDAPR